MTVQEHQRAIAEASRALDAALRAAKDEGYSVKVNVVEPMHTTQRRFIFVDLTIDC